ncbi:MAG: pyridoxal-phosphate dependent enzyme, partial [Ignavibacteriaceae bacterium]|nr:pyridoxal-phosphate dependent enzyme [Ignavibacteriaceae bacterium]
MSRYVYKCNQCKGEYSARQIENELVYLCPVCGTAEKKKPLNGVLSIEYDYNSLKKEVKRDEFLNIYPGKIFEYPYLYPLDYSSKKNGYTFPKISSGELNRLTLPSNSVIRKNFNGREIYFLDETRNLTYSFKDRASMLVALKAKQACINQISAASTGNAGSSIAGICSMLGMRSKIFVPKNIPEAKRIQIQSYGADIYVVDGDYDTAFDLCLEVSNKKKWYNRNTAYNPLTIEGKKSAAYDIFIQTGGEIPDLIFIPAGDGVIISGVYKGFVELLKLGWIEKLPKLIAVQAEGSCAIVDFIASGKFEYKPASTIADSISAGAPRNLFMAADAVKNSDGSAIAVAD